MRREMIFRIVVGIVAIGWTSFLFSQYGAIQKISELTSGPSEHLSVQDLTPSEQKEINTARKQLTDIEAKIRKNHGEAVRNFSNNSTTADCKGSQTTVEIRESQVLITDHYAGRGENPPCF